jgi:transcriptional regulator with XRE-family HTH domain
VEIGAYPSLASLLKAYRVARHLSQEALAERAGLTREAISLLERGRRLSPRRDTVSLLAKTLKLSPGKRASLLAAAAAQRGRTAIAALAAFSSPSSLPLRLTIFIGREQEIAEIQELLRSKRLLTLTGAGRIGKTSLALAVAAATQGQFVDGTALVELAALTDGELVPHAIATVLGVREQPGEPILTTLFTALGTTQRLLVIDNCEHLLLSCARVAEAMLQACPRLRILVTSREPLRIGAEVVWRVPSLTLPTGDLPVLDELATSEAVRLFVERAGAVRPGFALTATNGVALADQLRLQPGFARRLPAADPGERPPIRLGNARVGRRQRICPSPPHPLRQLRSLRQRALSLVESAPHPEDGRRRETVRSASSEEAFALA